MVIFRTLGLSDQNIKDVWLTKSEYEPKWVNWSNNTNSTTSNDDDRGKNFAVIPAKLNKRKDMKHADN